jgi:ribokinase
MVDRMTAAGVDCRHVEQSASASGHAIINVDADAENTIILYPGANRAISRDWVLAALSEARAEDVVIMQNETAHQIDVARFAQEQGLKVIYSAAPFEAESVREVLPFISILILNAVEAAQLCAALNVELAQVPVAQILVTHGADGAVWHDLTAMDQIVIPAFKVNAVDTSGAGDTFAGFFVAGIAEGMNPKEAMRLASAASSLKVTRAGTADAIPTRGEVTQFLNAQPSE